MEKNRSQVDFESGQNNLVRTSKIFLLNFLPSSHCLQFSHTLFLSFFLTPSFISLYSFISTLSHISSWLVTDIVTSKLQNSFFVPFVDATETCTVIHTIETCFHYVYDLDTQPKWTHTPFSNGNIFSFCIVINENMFSGGHLRKKRKNLGFT